MVSTRPRSRLRDWHGRKAGGEGDSARGCGARVGRLSSKPEMLVALVSGAWLLDQRTLYTTATPAWAQPGAKGFSLWRQLMYTVRTRGTLLRPWHVVPGRTIYTRVQLAHSLAPFALPASPLALPTSPLSPFAHGPLGCMPLGSRTLLGPGMSSSSGSSSRYAASTT